MMGVRLKIEFCVASLILLIMPTFIFSFDYGYRRIRGEPMIPQNLIRMYTDAGEVARQMAQSFDTEWGEHINNTNRMIEEGVYNIANKGKVSIWGGVNHLKYLAQNFRSVTLQNLDYPSLILAKENLPEELQTKVNVKEMDITSIVAPFVTGVEKIISESATAWEAIQKIITLMNESQMPEWNIPDEEKSDYIVFSLVLSQLMVHEFEYVKKLLIDKFTFIEVVSFFVTSDWENAKTSLKERVINSMIDKLAESIRSNGRIYLADTVVKKFVRFDQQGEIEVYKEEMKFSVEHLRELLNNRFSIYQESSWLWKMEPPQVRGKGGIFFQVEALILGLP